MYIIYETDGSLSSETKLAEFSRLDHALIYFEHRKAEYAGRSDRGPLKLVFKASDGDGDGEEHLILYNALPKYS